MSDISAPASAVPLLRDRSPGVDGGTNLGRYSPRLPQSTWQGHQLGAMSSNEPTRASSEFGGTPGSITAQTSGTGRSVRTDGGSGSHAHRKAAEAGVLAPPGQHPSTQFILHTDIEDSVPLPVHEVIELPPQYSERRPTPFTT